MKVPQSTPPRNRPILNEDQRIARLVNSSESLAIMAKSYLAQMNIPIRAYHVLPRILVGIGYGLKAVEIMTYAELNEYVRVAYDSTGHPYLFPIDCNLSEETKQDMLIEAEAMRRIGPVGPKISRIELFRLKKRKDE